MNETELRELDRQIHEVVFGFTDIRMLPTYLSPDCGSPLIAEPGWAGTKPDLWYLPKYDHDSKGDAFCRPVPRYSADMNSAWLVVEKMIGRLDSEPILCESIAIIDGVREWHALIGENGEGSGATAPIAICWAAIAAVEAMTQ